MYDYSSASQIYSIGIYVLGNKINRHNPVGVTYVRTVEHTDGRALLLTNNGAGA